MNSIVFELLSLFAVVVVVVVLISTLVAGRTPVESVSYTRFPRFSPLLGFGVIHTLSASSVFSVFLVYFGFCGQVLRPSLPCRGGADVGTLSPPYIKSIN